MLCTASLLRVLILSATAPAVLFPQTVGASGQTADGLQGSLSAEVVQLKALVAQLQARVEKLESSNGSGPSATSLARTRPDPEGSSPQDGSAQVTEKPAVSSNNVVQPAKDPPTNLLSGPLAGTSVNLLFDGYYEYNFNKPIGRANLLRAYDVSSNSFSINQVGLLLENAPDLAKNKRWGARVDLQWGQATQTLQGNAFNEARPDLYRNLFQAYGTYIVPVGKGVTVDFGKWASSLGAEGNYTKDQANYSRSFWFNYLPYYHAGFRANYKFTDSLDVNYWVVNGTQQTEAINGFKDQLFGFDFTPSKQAKLTVNYYLGQEHPDVVFYPANVPGNAPTSLPQLQNVPFLPIRPALTGKTHIFDSYLNLQATSKLNLLFEGDYVISRELAASRPDHTSGGSLVAKYQFTPKLALAARAEYLSDRSGLFSGNIQSLKETTITAEYKLAEGFSIKQEWRRDASNHVYFFTDTLGILKKEQNTASMGLVWWFGPKTESW